ncbi:hypothetical protein DF185_05625 [Marinifilum breve]|uniref:HAD-IB family hydrolase n=1 Tax=Marinifilum breve TaxID=2184082 RepID=A0A2V4ADL2_9BACT|nr:HAD family hydrolase [Marinifilum breve]PXY02124.1 hypothetical protein DF185_05625 [Marinifilum breve]
MDRRETIVFDFDRTLTTFDTTLDFFQFCGRKKSFFLLRYYLYLFLWLMQKLELISNLQLKNWGVKLFIQPYHTEEMHQLAKEFSSRIKLNQIYDYNFKNECSNARVIIVSAAFKIFLEQLFPNIEIIATSLAIKEGRYFKIEEHIYGEKKAFKLLEKGVDKIDRIYTDSKSDLSMALMSAECYLVVNSKIKSITSNSCFDHACENTLKSKKIDYWSILFCRYQNLGLK